MHGRSRRTRAWQGHARARGHTTRMRVATNRAGILLAIMRPGQLKKEQIDYLISPSFVSFFMSSAKYKLSKLPRSLSNGLNHRDQYDKGTQ